MSDIKVGVRLVHDGEPYVVTASDHHKMGRGGAILKTKLKHLVTGAVIDKTYQGNDKAEEADLANSTATYLYNDGVNYTFMDTESFEQFELSAEQVEDIADYMPENEDVEILIFNGKPVSVELPQKIVLEVVEAPPGVKGDTSDGGGTKEIELSTGLRIKAPLFIKKGEKIRINTETGEYVERA